MSQSRDFGAAAQQMRAALERYSKTELVDLMTHIMKVYVLDGEVSPDIEVGLISPPLQLERMRFTQLISHLQMTLDHEELEQFRVHQGEVYITIGEQEFNILGPTPELVPNTSPETPTRAPEPPRDPLTGQAEFEVAPPTPTPRAAAAPGNFAHLAREAASGRPQPEAVVRRRRPPAARANAPSAPPPIARNAPGDLPEEERRDVRASNNDPFAQDDRRPSQESAPQRAPQRASNSNNSDGPPSLSGDDQAVAPSNRFADLDF